MSPHSGVRTLAGLLHEARSVLVFTGAGISTGSGIPDFRGPQGTWKRRRPVYFQDFLASEDARVEHWDYKLEGFEAFRGASPNAGHRALAELDRLGRVALLVTQNIDGLHAAAGHDPAKIVELHGTNRLIECLSCRKTSDPEPAFAEFKRTRKSPRCACGGFLKTATISFGQAMPKDLLDRSFAAAKSADLVLAIGSTLEVEPAASVPRLAAENGARYAIVNQGATAHDGIATLRLEGDATILLPEAVALLRERT